MLLTLLLLAQASPAAPLPQFQRLASGLSACVVEDRGLPLVSVQLWYRAGSVLDPPGRDGTCMISMQVLAERTDLPQLRRHGLVVELEVAPETAHVAALAVPSQLDALLARFALAAEPRSVTAEKLRAAAAVLHNEPAARDAGWRHRVLPALLGEHPYARDPRRVLPAAESLEDVEEFVERWLTPANATLLIVGDVAPERAWPMIHRHFGAMPPGDVPRRELTPRPTPSEARVALRGPPALDLVWATPPAWVRESPPLDVLMHYLCNPIDGRLPGMLPADVELSWRRVNLGEGGLLALSLRPGSEAASPLDSQALERRVREALRLAASDPPPEIALNRARALAQRDLREARAALPDRARLLARHHVLEGEILLAEFALPRLERIYADDLRAAAEALARAPLVRAEHGEHPSDEVQPSGAGTGEADSRADDDRGLRQPAARGGAADRSALPAPAWADLPRPAIRRLRRGDVELVACVVPDAELACVITRLASEPSSTCGAWSAGQAADYATYHGLRLGADAGLGALTLGPAALGAQMVELHARLAPPRGAEPVAPAEQPRAARVRVYVVGDIDPEVLLTAAHAAWTHETAPGTSSPASTGARTVLPNVRSVVRLSLDDVPLPPAQRALATAMLAEVLAEQAPDWGWRAELASVHATTPPADATDRLRELLVRARTADPDLTAVLEAARARAWLNLNSAERIARTLAWLDGDPWQLAGVDVEAAALWRAIRAGVSHALPGD